MPRLEVEEGKRSLIAFSQLFIYVKLVGKPQKCQILQHSDLDYSILQLPWEINCHLSFYSRYNIQAVFKVTEANGWDLKHLAASEVRIIILYCTQSEASMILEAAEKFGLTSNKYLWLVTQSVIGVSGDRSVNRRSLPVGMLGIHFEVDMMKVLQPFVSLGLRTLFHAVDTILHNEEAASTSEDVTQASLSQPQFNFSLNCQGVDSNHRWEGGPTFYR